MLCVPLTPIGQVQAVKAVGRGAIRKDDLVREIMADFGDTNHRNPMYRAPRTRRWRPLPPPPPFVHRALSPCGAAILPHQIYAHAVSLSLCAACVRAHGCSFRNRTDAARSCLAEAPLKAITWVYVRCMQAHQEYASGQGPAIPRSSGRGGGPAGSRSPAVA